MKVKKLIKSTIKNQEKIKILYKADISTPEELVRYLLNRYRFKSKEELDKKYSLVIESLNKLSYREQAKFINKAWEIYQNIYYFDYVKAIKKWPLEKKQRKSKKYKAQIYKLFQKIGVTLPIKRYNKNENNKSQQKQ